MVPRSFAGSARRPSVQDSTVRVWPCVPAELVLQRLLERRLEQSEPRALDQPFLLVGSVLRENVRIEPVRSIA
jgi:hypothetical protein